MKYFLIAMGACFVILTAGCNHPPVIKYLDKACIEEGVRYQYKTCNKMIVLIDKRKVVVPKGFDTDLASIPRQLWSIYSPAKSETMSASILHDYLYNCPNGYTRYEADKIFYYSLLNKNLSVLRAGLYWSAVRMFGAKAYNPKGPCPDGV